MPAQLPPRHSVRPDDNRITSTCASTVVTADGLSPRGILGTSTPSTVSTPRGQAPPAEPSPLSALAWTIGVERVPLGEHASSLVDTTHTSSEDYFLNESDGSRAIVAAALGDSFRLDLNQLISLSVSAARRRLNDEEVRALPRVRFEAPELQSCSICLEHFRHGMLLSGLRCGHVFHVDCLAQWVQRAALCPNCRSVIQPVDYSPES